MTNRSLHEVASEHIYRRLYLAELPWPSDGKPTANATHPLVEALGIPILHDGTVVNNPIRAYRYL
jgi:hypothetical protein